jgi:hypothetical protein
MAKKEGTGQRFPFPSGQGGELTAHPTFLVYLENLITFR